MMKSSIYHWVNSGRVCALISFVLLMCVTLLPLSVAAEQQQENECSPALKKESYIEYLLAVDKTRIERIQEGLRQINIGDDLAVDGVLGASTRSALYDFCRGLKSVPDENFVSTLVKKLDQKSALITAIDNTVNDSSKKSVATEVVPTPEPVVETKAPVNVAVAEATVEAKSMAAAMSSDSTTLAIPAVVQSSSEKKSNTAMGAIPAVYYQLTQDDLDAVIEESAAPQAEEVTAADTEVETGEKGVDSKTDTPNSVVDKKAVVAFETPPTEDALARLAVLVDVPFVNRAQFLQAVTAKSGIDSATYPEFMARIEVAGLKQSSKKLESIVLGADCGCVREFSDIIYGFYPYWRATKQSAPGPAAQDAGSATTAAVPPMINYSVLNRIAYYGLTLEESGEITAPLHWNSNGKLGNFINIAHRHKTKVDLTIYSNDWPQWSESSMNASIMSVYSQLMVQTEYRQPGVMSYVPFFNTTVATPDGVTLYFDRYADHPESRYKIVEFVSQLYDRLADLDREYTINILLDVSKQELENGKPLFSDIKHLLLTEQKDTPVYVESLLLFLDEPTTDTKKILRSKIENEFSGNQRMKVLRKVVPVISPYGHENDELGPYDQFNDDLVYFKDNFAGVGLWPLPMVADADAANVSQRLIDVFSASDVDGLLNALSSHFPALCDVACPNRWAFRLSLDLLLFMIVLYGVLALFSQRLRRFYSRYSIYFMFYIVVMVIIFTISLTCDPFWKQRRDIVFLGSLLLVAALFMMRKYRQAKQGPLP